MTNVLHFVGLTGLAVQGLSVLWQATHMVHVLSFSRGTELIKSFQDEVKTVDLLVRRFAPAPIASGSLRRVDLANALRPHLERSGYTFRDSYQALDKESRRLISFHAGRSFTNNEVVWETLRAADDPFIREVLFVVPTAYKGSSCAPKVVEQLEFVSGSAGVRLALDNVAVLACHS